jgi:hypothetical protein
VILHIWWFFDKAVHQGSMDACKTKGAVPSDAAEGLGEKENDCDYGQGGENE